MEYERNRAGDWRYGDLARRVDQLETWQRDHDQHHVKLQETVGRIEHRATSIDNTIKQGLWLLGGALVTGMADFIVNTLTRLH